MKKTAASIRCAHAFRLLTSAATIAFGVLLLSRAPALADKIVLFAGGGDKLTDARAAEVKLTSPFGIVSDSDNNFYLVEMVGGERVRKIDRNGFLTTFAGTGEKGFSGDGGPAARAQFNGMHNLAIAPNRDLYLADTWNSRVRKIDLRAGIVSTFAGTGTAGAKAFGGDGKLATEAQFGNIYCASLDPKGENLYLADLDNRRIRAVNLKTGLVRTVAGNGEKGVPADGADAVKAPLMRIEMSMCSNAAATDCASWIRPGKSAPSSAPARRA